MQVSKLPEHFPIFGIQSFDKCGIGELGLAVRFGHVAKRVQPLQQGLPPRWGQLLPARKQRLPDISLLLRSHLLPNALPIAQGLLLSGSQAVPGFQSLANLRLPFRRQAQEPIVVPQKLFLAARRHILKPLDGLGGQIVCIACGRQRIRHVRPHLLLHLLPQLPPLLGGARRFTLLLRGALDLCA